MTSQRIWNEVEALFQDKAFPYENLDMLILRKEQALKFIEECRRRKIPILGIDAFLTGNDIEPMTGFTIKGDSIQPIQDYSVDFSLAPFTYDVYNVDEIYAQSTELINKSPDHIHFEITCGDATETNTA